LPPIELPWFDVEAGRWQVARIESRTIEVLPTGTPLPADASESRSGPTQPAAATASALWPWLAALFGVGWLATAAAWGFTSRRPRVARLAGPAAPREQSTRSLFRQLGAACQVNDPRRSRELLLAWGQRQFSDDPPPHLGALAARLGGPLAAEIEALQAALYGPRPGEWRGAGLAGLLRQTQAVGRPTGAGDDQDPLLPLYR
jgi:hypothetical protein